MNTKHATFAVLGLAAACLALVALAPTAEARGVGNPLGQGIVYVSGQNLFYDTQVPVSSLPPHGAFQELVPGAGPGGLSLTYYGPGDSGYVGGRWWVDENGNREMDDEDSYFLCPLMGPGRTTP